MFAIISLGGKQYKVEKDMVFLADKTGKSVGEEFQAPSLLVAEENKISIATPSLSGSAVTLKVVEDCKSRKLHALKYKKRKNYKRQWGHRQQLQKLQVLKINPV